MIQIIGSGPVSRVLSNPEFRAGLRKLLGQFGQTLAGMSNFFDRSRLEMNPCGHFFGTGRILLRNSGKARHDLHNLILVMTHLLSLAEIPISSKEPSTAPEISLYLASVSAR